jgi:hypothetical protein
VSPVAVQLQTRTATGRRLARRPGRSTRMVSLRSSLPTGLVTLRHDVPEYLSNAPGITTGATAGTDTPKQDATPKVETAGRAQVRTQIVVDTPARKGGSAR